MNIKFLFDLSTNIVSCKKRIVLPSRHKENMVLREIWNVNKILLLLIKINIPIVFREKYIFNIYFYIELLELSCKC